MNSLISIQLTSRRGPTEDTWSSPPAPLSTLIVSVTRTLAALTSPDFQLYFFNSGNPLGSTCVPLPAAPPRNSLKAVIWGNHKAHFAGFPSLKDQCLLFSWFLVLKTTVSSILSVLFWFGGLVGSVRSINSIPSFLTWPEIEVLNLICNLL